ncbi:uncharacterized protein LOC134683205 isoform X2 [Mytilus trossulus]|uniref:uncharacterized protein LOC134683205 isoform X2 n=1 Tax=Mytilus trossulus TaxID=6551 RepID=UPI0030050EE5
MSTSAAKRKATLGKHVLVLFPKVMQTILKEHITPKGLQVKYRQNDIRTALTDSEISFMEKLPSLDEFTIELCYKILRYEHVIHEPKCTWGNVPNSTEVEISDDIQRILNLTNEVIGEMSAEIPIEYYEDFQKKTQEILKRIDAYLNHDSCLKLYKTISKSDMNYIEIISKLADVKPIIVRANRDSDVDESFKREFYSRISLVVIEKLPKILRNILQSSVSARDLYGMCIPKLHYFNTDQQTSLQTLRRSGSYDSLDIGLIYKLFRLFSLIPPPTKGWGMYPDKTDIKVADDVERIRQYKNKIAHRCNPDFDKDEFDDYFNKFRDIGHRMDATFFQKTNYENEIIEIKTCRLDSDIQIKYTDAMKQLESIKLRFEKRPLKIFWEENLDTSLENLRSLVRKETVEGKLRIQIIFQNKEDVESTTDILNSLRDDINKNLSGIEFIVAIKDDSIQTTTSSLRTYCTIDESYADGTTERYDIMGDRGSASLDKKVSESKQKVLELKFGERIQARPRSSSLSQLNVSIIEDDSEKGSARLTTEYSIDEKCTAAFEMIYKHIICRNMLSMSDCIKQNLDLAVRCLLTRNIPPTELSEYLHESMKEKKNVISKAIGWTITKQFCKDTLPTKVINSFIDIWPGYRCRCEKHRAKGHSRICSTEPVIIVEVDKFSKAIPDAFYGIPVQQSYQETKGEHTKVQCHKEKTDVSSFKDNIIQKPVTISGEIAEVLFKQHSKITMIHVHPFRRTSIQLWGQIKGVIPMGEKHFPKMINGLDTCIAEGHVRFMAKIKIGDTIGVPGSSGTLGGFVQMHGHNAFLTCAHVVHNKNRLIAGNKRELHKSKTKVFCLDRCNPNSSVESGCVFNAAFDLNNAGGTSVDAAVVILDEEKVSFDEKDILNKVSCGPVSADFIGMKGPYLNDNYITPKAVSGTVTARYLGVTSGYVESDVSFKDYDEDDENFKTEPKGLCLYFKDLPAHLQDIESECPKPAETPFEVHFQQLMASKLEERIKSGRHFFRCYKQLLFTDFSFKPGDSGTCIYVVEDKTIIRPDNQPNPTGCLAMAIASFYDSNEHRNKCIATPMHAILKRLGLI